MPKSNKEKMEMIEMKKIPKTCPDCKVKLWSAEIPELYDGTSYWFCPKCQRKWDRWTGDEILNLAKHTFDRFNEKKGFGVKK
jgi:transposase-like protein